MICFTPPFEGGRGEEHCDFYPLSAKYPYSSFLIYPPNKKSSPLALQRGRQIP